MTVLVLPGLLPYAEAVGVRGRVRRLAPIRGVPEAAWVGLPPVNIADGPLVVAALGAEPPERTMQFHLSVLGLDETLVWPPVPTPEEEAVLRPLLSRLDTKRLTAVKGEGLDHALVMEGWWDLGTKSPDQATGKPPGAVLPEGDQEETLRRYIDDSVNLLSDLEINARRIDQGVAPLNVLWPWGQGAPRRLTNLALYRGESLTVASDSLRMRGMARLVGYRPLRHKAEPESLLGGLPPGIVLVDAFSSLEVEQAVWTAERLGQHLPDRTLLIAPTDAGGLVVETGMPENVPFREEVADDRTVPNGDPWEAVDDFLTPK